MAKKRFKSEDFNNKVDLPQGLTIKSIEQTIDFVEKELSELIEIYEEQANVFSALVGIYGIKALDSVSVYEKNRDKNKAQQRFPDLKKRGSGQSPTPQQSLECKGSKRPWSIQSHYDHPGWYIVFRYLVDPTCSIESGRPVIIWRIDIVYLKKEDWKYEGSKAGDNKGGRTHTFGLVNPAKKLKNASVYKRSDFKISGGKAIQINGKH